MKKISLTVDNESCRIYEDFSPDCREKFDHEVNMMLHATAQNARAMRLKKMVQEINNDTDGTYLNADVLLELLPID